mgnify:FL=1
MPGFLKHSLILPVLAAVAFMLAGESQPAQAQVDRGFSRVIRVYATGEERNRQPNLWVLEVHLKQMRMRWVDVTVDPETGETQRELVWYLVFKAINRTIDTGEDTQDTVPVNQFDPVPQPPKFIPKFTLTTYANPADEIPDGEYTDVPLPEAVAEINRVESHRPNDPVLADTVTLIRDLPEPVDEESDDGEWMYGVATWRNVDPDTDFFKVTMAGFSNGYVVIEDDDGNTTTWRKVLVQRFTRQGDRYDPTQVEFRFDGRADWIYQPEEGDASATEAAPVEEPSET